MIPECAREGERLDVVDPVMCKSQLGGEGEERVDDDREERGKPRDLGYVGFGYHR